MADDRVNNVNLAFQSTALQSQFTAWAQQRDMLRETVADMFADGLNFKNWWIGSASEVRAALVMTALEDLPEHTAFSSLISVVCPELLEPNNFLDSQGDKISLLLKILIDGRENQKEVFDFSMFLDDFDEGHAKPSDAAQNAMQLARSCILLQFGTSVMLVYNAQKEMQ